MKRLFAPIDKIKQRLRDYFVANDIEPAMVRKKHLRLGAVLTSLFLLICYLVQNSGDQLKNLKYPETTKPEIKDKIKTSSGLEELAKGTSNELLWTEIEGKELDELKNKQADTENAQKTINQQLATDKVSKTEMENMLIDLSQTLEAKYEQKLAEEIAKVKIEEKKKIEASIESKSFKQKKKALKLGEYIPANSYAQAKLISGVDAGVGMSAESNPRSALLRITGEVVSAGFGGKYLKTNKLIGCQMSLRAVGDISSEKVYLDGVLMSCAKDANNFIEIPVKAYVSSLGKTGVRGEIVSREGDMVLKSFVAGIASGFGNGVTQFSAPQQSLLGSNTQTETQKIKSIMNGGLGSGLSSGSNSLAEFFIKRAEQYQPVISVNEGVEVNIVFIEGFSLKETQEDEKSN
ncbi:MAG: TraB/VirB10 family protein [Candidatus Poribacteria bacterium]